MRTERIGNATLILGDCLTVMETLADQSVDLILCDLPYGMTANKWDTVIPFAPLWASYLRVAKPTAAIVLTASQPFTSALVMSQPNLFRHEWIWMKNRGSNFANTVREPMKEHESVIVFSRGKWTYNPQMQTRAPAGASRAKYKINQGSHSSNYRNFVERTHSGLPEMRVPSSCQEFICEVGYHPTQKPVPLMEHLIRTYSNPGDLVLDNCMGSGSTGVGAMRSGRDFVGIELDPVHFQTAVGRITAATRQTDLFVQALPTDVKPLVAHADLFAGPA